MSQTLAPKAVSAIVTSAPPKSRNRSRSRGRAPRGSSKPRYTELAELFARLPAQKRGMRPRSRSFSRSKPNITINVGSRKAPKRRYRGRDSFSRLLDQSAIRPHQSPLNRPIAPSEAVTAQQKPSAQVTVPVSNLIDMGSSSLGVSSVLPIHPSNFRLFPNLGQFWQNFQQFHIRRFNISTQPQSSTLASGAYCITTIANGATGANFLPAFSFLANLATSAIATLWRPMVYKVAETVLNRLRNYLVSSDDQATSSPGSIAISYSGDSSNADSAPPLYNVEAEVHFQDFQPSTSSSTVPYLGFGFSATVNGFVMLLGAYTAQTANPPALTIPSPGGLNTTLFTLSGASGNFIMCLRVQYVNGTTDWAPGFSFAGKPISPMHVHTTLIGGVTYVQRVFSLTLNGTGSFVCSKVVCWNQGLQAVVGDFSLSSFADSDFGFYPHLYRHLQGHINHSFSTGTVHSVLPEITEEEEDEFALKSLAKLSLKEEEMCGRWESFTPSGEGWCWLEALLDLAKIEVYSRGTQLMICSDLGDFEVPKLAFLPRQKFLQLLDQLQMRQTLSSHYRLIVQGRIGHLVKRKAASDDATIDFSLVDVVGGRSPRTHTATAAPLFQEDDGEVPPKDKPPD